MLDRKLYRIIIDTLGKAHFEYYPDNFSKRILVQKVLYLLTHGKANPKLHLAYKWSFYLHGPYSSEIAHMVYYMNDFSASLLDETQDILDKQEIEAINHFKEFDKETTPFLDKLSKEDLYEMFATITYISEQVDYNKTSIEQKFGIFKPELREKINMEDFDAILETMTEFNYI
ncbi:hypothetical protein DSAG12_00614 [Promethearchaeum syntrophicum]|uniref:Antitoxin SocA-like Panacea domain-containing protein n=1 Tax=Promethearchaeum syntrophicum TaxID=2594042 RepID=A0A5B9D7H4_9ARCH|nr:hypothetical protein [Candidatus Prometheoarchaeum syntrophicum]QEE14797.1 hypothetical protein DSAG12_00614 [Candidatus Prometheoarchaeum syntrophicum]